jgi:hypothetical protein
LIHSKIFKTKERELINCVDYSKSKNWVLDYHSSFSLKINRNVMIFWNDNNISIVDMNANILYPISSTYNQEVLKNHIFIYNNSDYETIFHTHSVEATAITTYFKDTKISLSSPLYQKIDIPIVDELSEVTSKYYLIRENGLISISHSTEELMRHLQTIEYLLKVKIVQETLSSNVKR